MKMDKPTCMQLKKMIGEQGKEMSGMKKLLEDQASMMKEIKKTNEMLVTELKEVRQKLSNQTKVIDGLKDSLSYLGKDVEDLKNKNKVMDKEMKLIKKSNVGLADKVVKVQDNERALTIRVNQMENFLKGNNIEIQGVAVSENETKEDLEKVTMNVLKIVEPRILREQIGNIKRLRPANTNHKTDGKRVFNPILVQFKTREAKVNIMKEKKKLANANLNGISDGKVYINENLTKYSRNLLFHARKFRRDHGWMFAWCSQGTILMKKKENSQTIVINSMEDIDRLQK